MSSLHNACSEKGLKCTDMEIINPCRKWLGQTKTRVMRAQMKINKGHGGTAVNEGDLKVAEGGGVTPENKLIRGGGDICATDVEIYIYMSQCRCTTPTCRNV